MPFLFTLKYTVYLQNGFQPNSWKQTSVFAVVVIFVAIFDYEVFPLQVNVKLKLNRMNLLVLR